MLLPDIRFSDEKNIFLLLDGAQFENLGQKIYASGSVSSRALYGGTRLQAALHVSPWLVGLSETSPLLDEFLDQGVRAWHGCLLESDSDLEVTADHLAWLCVARHSEAAYVALRFFDPRIFPGLLEALPAVEQTLFLGPVRKVWIPDPDQEDWLVLERPMPFDGITPDYSRFYTLNAAQEKAMDQASWDFFIKGLARDLAPSCPDVFAGQSAEERAYFYAEKAISLGFITEEEIYDFCHLCCLLAPNGETPWETESPALRSLMRHPNPLGPAERIEKALAHITAQGGRDD